MLTPNFGLKLAINILPTHNWWS